MADPAEESMLVVGSRCSAGFARWSRKDEAVKAWEGLEIRARAKLLYQLRPLCEGESLPKEQMRHLGDGIYEIKPVRRKLLRVAVFRHGGSWWLTHFFKAPHRKKKVNLEIDRAKRARQEHLEGGGQ